MEVERPERPERVVPSNVKLHMIWAHRGDAFVLDYHIGNIRRLLLVDGGPIANIGASDNQNTPYFRHYISALNDIWGTNQNTTIKLDIVVSHVDNDHYGGILKLLLLQGVDSGSPIDWSDVNLFIPNLRENGYTRIINACKKNGMHPEPMGAKELAGFTMHFPSNSSINQVYQGANGMGGPNPDLVDVSEHPGSRTNASSIILQNNTAQATKNGSVFFTGDSASFRINPAIGSDVPHLAIYKIQHHGAHAESLHDPQHRAFHLPRTTLSTFIVWQCMEWVATGEYPPANTDKEFKAVDLTALQFYAATVVEACDRFLKAQGHVSVSYDNFRATLGNHRLQYIAQAHAFQPASTQNNMLPELPDLIAELGEAHPIFIVNFVEEELSKHDLWKFYYRSSFDLTESPLNRDLKGWWSFIIKYYIQADVDDAYNMGQCATFYKSFRADAYVVSGTFGGRYQHPRPQVLCGLALACWQQGWTASLYLTDPRTFWRTNIQSWVELMNLINAGLSPPDFTVNDWTLNDYFAGKGLKVCYLENQLYITLDANETIQIQGRDQGEGWNRLMPDQAVMPISWDILAKDRQEAFLKLAKQNTSVLFNESLQTATYQLNLYKWSYPSHVGAYLGSFGNSPFELVPEIESAQQFFVREFAFVLEGHDHVALQLTNANQGGADPVTHTFVARQLGDTDYYRLARFVTDDYYEECSYRNGKVEFVSYIPWLRINWNTLCVFEFKRTAIAVPVGLQTMNYAEPTPTIVRMISEEEEETVETTHFDRLAPPTLPALPAVPDLPSLRSYLLEHEFSSEASAKLRLMEIFQYMLGPNVSQDQLSRLWSAIPTIFRNEGLLQLVPDLDNSTVETYTTPTGFGTIKDAMIVAHMNSNIFPSSLEIAGIKFEIGQVALRFIDVGLSTQEISLTGSVSVGSGSSRLGLTMKCTLGADLPEMSFQVSDQSNITSLTQLQSSIDALNITGIQKLDVPILKGEAKSKKPLSALPSGSKFGFSIRERMTNTKRFELSSIFLAVDSNDWKDYLPETLKVLETGVRTNIAVLRPTSTKPVVHAQVDFQVKTESGKLLSFSFAAFPLAFPGSYDYRMMLDCIGGVTLDDIGKTLGIDVLESSVISEIPLVTTMLSEVAATHFDAAVSNDKQKSKVSWEDWSIDLVLRNGIVLIPDKFELGYTRLSIRHLGGKAVSSSGSADLHIKKLNKHLHVEFETPQNGAPGYIAADCASGILVQDLLSIFGVNGLDEVPVVKDLLHVGAKSFKACFGYKPVPNATPPAPGYESSLSVLGASVEFFSEEPLTLALFELSQVDVSLYSYGVHHPFANGRQQKGFKITAQIFNRSATIEVLYEARDDEPLLAMSIYPSSTSSPVTVRKMLETIMPTDLTSDLPLSLLNIRVNFAVLGFRKGLKGGDTTNNLDRFDIQLSTTPPDGHGGGLKLTDFTASFRRGRTTTVDASSSALQEKTGTDASSDQTGHVKESKFDTPKSSKVIQSVANATMDGPVQSWNRNDHHAQQNTLIISSTISIGGKRARLAYGYGAGDIPTDKMILFGVTEVDSGALRLGNIVSLFGPGDSGGQGSLWDLDIFSTGRSDDNLKPSPISSLAPGDHDLAAILASFGLGDFSQIPLLDELMDVRVMHCDCAFSKSPQSGKAEMRYLVADLRIPKLSVGSIAVKNISFSIACYRTAVVGETAPIKSTVDFQLSAKLEKANALLKVRYNGRQDVFSGSILPFDSSPLKIVKILKQVLPGTDSVLRSYIDNLTINSMEISLDKNTVELTSFHMELSHDSKLELEGATDDKAFVLNSLRLDYCKITSAESDAKSEAQFKLHGAVRVAGVEMALSLSTLAKSDSKSVSRSADFLITLSPGRGKDPGLRALLIAAGLNIDEKDIAVPEGCPSFDVGLRDIKGKFMAKDGSKLKLAQLSLQVEAATEWRLVEDPNITLSKAFLNVSYNRSNSNGAVSALVVGDLDIAESVKLSIGYKRTGDYEEFRAKGDAVTSALTKNSGPRKLQLASIMERLIGYTTDSSIPDFIAQAEIDLDDTSVEMALTRKKVGNESTSFVSISVRIGTLAVQIARMKTDSKDTTKSTKSPWKTIVRFAVGQLPRPPPLPMVGQIEQPFSIDSHWASDIVSPAEVSKLNTLGMFEKNKMAVAKSPSQGIAFQQGISFMLLHNGEPFLVSKAKNSKDDDGNSEDLETKKFEKRVNGVSITNVGLGYDAKTQKIKIKFTARASIGPLDGELINFVMAVRLPRATGGGNILLRDWSKLAIEMDLDGLSLAMTGSTLNVAGTLQRVKRTGEDMVVEGFEGGISVKVKKYEFTGFGSYRGVKHASGDEFVSLIVYAMVQGPILRTPYVEVRGISGGFGLGSQLIIPPIDKIHNFPLLMEPTSSSSNAMTTFTKLRDSGGQQFMTETNGASWVAAGVLATACEVVDISAIVKFPLDPNVGQIDILGTASARFPREESSRALASIRLNFSGTIDVAHGSLVFQGQIADKSFLLLEDCKLTGGFAVGAWFGPSPQAGDWCISIGGWHPAYIAPAHYPAAPPRMGISWSYKNYLSLTGTAYAAVTPDALMGGLAVHAAYKLGPLEASFDFQADLILYMHPLHYDAQIQISANLSYEVSLFSFARKISIPFKADLHISGPPLYGYVYFDWAVIQFKVEFGDRSLPPKILNLNEFVKICLKKDENLPNSNHVLSLEDGAVVSNTMANEPQRPNTPWTVRGQALAFSVTSRIPATSIDFSGSKVQSNRKILSRPMQLPSESEGIKSELDVTILRKGSTESDHGFRFEAVEERVPASLWGPYDSNTNAMLSGTSRESTIVHTTGLRIRAPEPKWSEKNSLVVPFSDKAHFFTTLAEFPPDDKLVKDFPKKRIIDGGKMDMGSAMVAILGRNHGEELTPKQERDALASRNKRRAAIINSWATFRNLSKKSATATANMLENASSLPIKTSVPQRYARGLDHFCHVAPRVAIS
ncbi:hypothetical protein BKA59DRAFT_481274 [Fusarium tricinctum]|uniref:DUF6603 domain-containing protein n=1 Tax=Fusarium tricinctum TaxID=61284 RepID=A0A8K0RWM3_9HYPO|nr:hypothetical protein BKA59DRAFT_481274 [Fusarium tricinctum]